MKVTDDVNKHRKEISTDAYTTDWRNIMGQYKDKSLIIAPDYQRYFRWSLDQQTQYIESILLGIPSPALFFAENEDGTVDVLDGLQRVSTLLKFFAEENFAEKSVENKNNEENQNILFAPTILLEGPIINSLEGFSAKTLPETLLRTIKQARITIILVKRESERVARIEVFRRLNRYGATLSDQEIRNAIARQYGSDFPNKLHELAKTDSIANALSLSDEAEKRMGVDELILRLLAFNYSKEPFKHGVTEYLDKFMTVCADGKFEFTTDMQKRVLDTFELINLAFPDYRAFRYLRSGFSTNLFDVITTGIYNNIDKLTPEIIKTRHAELLASDDIKSVSGAGSNTRKKVTGRLDLGKKWFS